MTGVSGSGASGAAGCAAGLSSCGTECKNLSIDGANCGTCGHACAAGESCQSGTCACAPGRTSCSGTCIDTQSDAANCGACGSACAAGLVCSKGACTTGCAPGLTRCGSACVDITGSSLNCGSCGTMCRADQSCWMGGCRCATGQADCGGVCKDVTSSAVNCGTCGNVCASGATCVAGVCTCPPGNAACGGVCRNVAADPQNCGTCGTVCGGGTSCLFGGCIDPNSVNCGGGAQANNTCTNFDSILMGKYWINNNGWGVSSGSGQQCIWSNCQTGDLIGWGTSFNWSGSPGQVKTYASAVFGWHFGTKIANTGLPIQLNTTRAINCGWAFNVTQTGTATMTLDVAYDLFAHSISNPGCCDNPTDEIMVWLYRAGGAGPIGNTVATPTIGGTSWDLHVGTNRTQNAAGWNVFSYVRTANATTSVLNMMDFMHDLINRGLISNTKYLSSVQAGSEVFVGAGQLQTNGFYCRIQ